LGGIKRVAHDWLRLQRAGYEVYVLRPLCTDIKVYAAFYLALMAVSMMASYLCVLFASCLTVIALSMLAPDPVIMSILASYLCALLMFWLNWKMPDSKVLKLEDIGHAADYTAPPTGMWMLECCIDL
jgi:hypothetical protein